MPRLSLLAMAAAMTLMAVAARSDDDSDKSDKGKLQGTWATVSLEDNGKEIPAEDAKMIKMAIAGDNYLQLIGDQVVEKGTFKLDESKSPKTIDLSIKDGDDAGKTQVGIYKLEGNKWVLCLARPGEETRPKKFASKDGDDGFIVVELKADKDN